MNVLGMRKDSVVRFARYSIVGVSTLLFDLALLFILTTYSGIPYYFSTGISFLIAVSINYAISRSAVFKGTERKISTGYIYFIGIALIGALLTTVSVYLLVTYLHLYFLLARVFVAGFIGVGNYVSNLYLNFKVAGIHSSKD